MKFHTFLAILVIVGAAYYWSDGGRKLGLITPEALPETVTPPNATFLGDEQSNPFLAE
jgi:hypothetical protein